MVVGVLGPVALKVPITRSLGEPDHPLAQVARVHVLRGVIGRTGRQNLAALVDAHRPVGEPIGQVAGAHDEPGAHDGDVVAPNRSRATISERTLSGP